MRKKTFHTETAYLLGIVSLAFGTALMEKADFGISMVVAPAYLIFRKLSLIVPFVTFGMAEYCFQAALLIVLMIVLRKVKISYLFSFVTAVVYGFVLDICMYLVSVVPSEAIYIRITFYVFGIILCSLGVSLLFHTYIAPEVYELCVKLLSDKYKIEISKFKTGYDCASCAIGIILSFAFFGMWQFVGVKLGTIICALINGITIGFISRVLEKHFDFSDRFKLRRFFE